MIDVNAITRRWWFSFASHGYDGWHLWLKPGVICRLGFITVGVGRRNIATNQDCLELDKKLKKWYLHEV